MRSPLSRRAVFVCALSSLGCELDQARTSGSAGTGVGPSNAAPTQDVDPSRPTHVPEPPLLGSELEAGEPDAEGEAESETGESDTGIGEPASAPAPRFTAKLARLEVRGCLDKAIIQRVSRAQRKTLRGCARRGTGEVDVRYLVGPQGTVLVAAAVTSTASTLATKCVTDAMRGWVFPKPKGSSAEVLQRVVLTVD